MLNGYHIKVLYGYVWLHMFIETEEGDVIDFLERRRVVAAKIFIVKMRPVRTKHFAHPGSISRNPFQLCASLATFHVLPLFCLLKPLVGLVGR